MLSRWHPYASISSCNRDIFQKYGRNTETCSVSICTREKADKYYHVLIYFSAFSHLLYKTLIHLGVTFREISISKCSLIFSFPAVLFFYFVFINNTYLLRSQEPLQLNLYLSAARCYQINFSSSFLAVTSSYLTRFKRCDFNGK